MSGLSVVQRTESVNGTVKRLTRKPKEVNKPPGSRKAMKHARRLACGVGAVGVGVLGMSVTHCTESIGLLTGSHWALSGLLAAAWFRRSWPSWHLTGQRAWSKSGMPWVGWFLGALISGPCRRKA